MSKGNWKALEDQGMLSFNEIARHFGVTEQAIKKTYLRAVEKLEKNPDARRLLEEIMP
jgi:predicted DNA-binding protein YlxM (UPF0122 family)